MYERNYPIIFQVSPEYFENFKPINWVRGVSNSGLKKRQQNLPPKLVVPKMWSIKITPILSSRVHLHLSLHAVARVCFIRNYECENFWWPAISEYIAYIFLSPDLQSCFLKPYISCSYLIWFAWNDKWRLIECSHICCLFSHAFLSPGSHIILPQNVCVRTADGNVSVLKSP